jgi:hypothetical protein
MAAIVIGMIAVPPAFAHKMLLDCHPKGERLRVEAFYDDDTPAQNAKVTVENESREIVLEGMTDDRGVWSGPRPVPGRYLVRAETLGHVAKGSVVISAEDSPRDPVAPAEQSTNRAAPSVAAPRDTDSHLARDGATGTPWLKIAIAFAIIAGLCALLRLARKGRSETAP